MTTPLILTNRYSSLRDVTVFWVEREYPMLRGAEFSFRSNTDTRDGVESKLARMPDMPVVLVDDDLAMLRHGDLFVLVPQMWKAPLPAWAYEMPLVLDLDGTLCDTVGDRGLRLDWLQQVRAMTCNQVPGAYEWLENWFRQAR